MTGRPSLLYPHVTARYSRLAPAVLPGGSMERDDSPGLLQRQLAAVEPLSCNCSEAVTHTTLTPGLQVTGDKVFGEIVR